LAQMALDFLSTPASSIDAERAFSGGCLQVNHLQHQMTSQSFKAKAFCWILVQYIITA
ncbi:hypothetical protein SCLCIDRAFT_144600, partial [Scleroderma citrinum Foug A]